MVAVFGVRRIVPVVWIALWVAACSPEASPTDKLDPTGILLVDVGEQVQAAPPTEELKVAFSRATELADANGDDLGYPWFDPASGELVLSAVTANGRAIVEAAGITVPYRIRDVVHGAAELERIQHEATLLRSEGIPGAELIYATGPDYRDNRTIIVISAMSRPLLDALAERFPADAIAVRVNPAGTG
jgi:hypothetical protein